MQTFAAAAAEGCPRTSNAKLVGFTLAGVLVAKAPRHKEACAGIAHRLHVNEGPDYEPSADDPDAQMSFFVLTVLRAAIAGKVAEGAGVGGGSFQGSGSGGGLDGLGGALGGPRPGGQGGGGKGGRPWAAQGATQSI